MYAGGSLLHFKRHRLYFPLSLRLCHFDYKCYLQLKLLQVALGEQRKWGRGVRKLSCTLGEQGTGSLADERCRHCYGVLRSRHVLLHPQPLPWPLLLIKGGGGGSWSADQGVSMRCQTARSRQSFPSLLQE